MLKYDFPNPVLIIYLPKKPNETGGKPASGYLETEYNKVFRNEPITRMQEYNQPYALFLDHFDKYDFGTIDALIAEMRAAYGKSVGKADEGLIERWSEYWRNSKNLYERHCIRTLLYDYRLSFEKKESASKINSHLDVFKIFFYRKEYPLMDVFAAYDLAPFHQITEQRKAEILRDDDWGKDIENYSASVLSDNPVFVIKYFIGNMKENKIYLQQCEHCGNLFVRMDKRKSALCQGSYCEQTPLETPMERFYLKNKLFKYRETKRNLSIYLSKMKKAGIFTDDFILKIRKESDDKKKRVEAGMFQEENYLRWLVDKHQECVHLAEEYRESNKRKNTGKGSGTDP